MALVTGEPFETLTPAAELLAKFNRKTEAAEFWQARVKAAPWDSNAGLRLALSRSDRTTLLSIAANNQAPYASRVEAAKAATGGTNLGSAELELLAASTPLQLTAVEKPYFYHARLQAARQTSDAATRIDLLRGAIAVDPNPPDPKLHLFRTHFQANQFEQAVAIFREGSPDKTVTRELATAWRKLGHLERARPLFASLNDKTEVAAIDAELQRRAENTQRMPRVHDGVDQPQPVRPRI
jgi:hypothetical protein